MCGISGIVDLKGRPVERDFLARLNDCMTHRGPDDAGFWTGGAFALGHRRLSIIDLSGGHQPLCNEDGTVWIAFNGEVYNFPELRTQLEAKGHVFGTHSDTETIVHAYEEWGADCPKHLRGMFAFAIADTVRGRLFLARDRTGKKPLLYTQAGGQFVFASEFRALLAHPDVSRRVNLPAIDLFLGVNCIAAPHTAYEGVYKLPPAHSLTLDLQGAAAGVPKIECYWSLAEHFDPARKQKISENDAADELLERLREAVKIRLMSEVPLGAFLSGGIDSSAVVAVMATLSDKPVKTFNINFEEGDFSEAVHARRLAEKFGCEHTEVTVRPDAAAILPLLVRHYGEPYADASAVPTYYVSQITRQHVTVALNGDGGDEVFAGYERYRAMQITENLPPALLKMGGAAANLIPGGLNFRSRHVRLKRLLQAAALPAPQRYLRWQSSFSLEQKHALYAPGFAEAVKFPASHPVADWVARYPQLDPVDRVQLCDTMTYLPDDLLVKVDIATMANSLEARSPFLDHPLMEWAATLPVNLKLKDKTGKFILRHAIRDLVPAENMNRPKMGFALPVGPWFRGELKEFLREAILSEKSLKRGYFQPDAVRRLYNEHIESRADHTFRLWPLLMLELWHREFVD